MYFCPQENQQFSNIIRVCITEKLTIQKRFFIEGEKTMAFVKYIILYVFLHVKRKMESLYTPNKFAKYFFHFLFFLFFFFWLNQKKKCNKTLTNGGWKKILYKYQFYRNIISPPINGQKLLSVFLLYSSHKNTWLLLH